MRNSHACLFLFLLFSCVAFAEDAYISFLPGDSGPPLTAAEISGKLEGKPLVVKDLMYVDTASRPADLLRRPGARRNYVMVFDLLHASPQQLFQLRQAAVELIGKIGPVDLAAILAVNAKGDLLMLSGLTADRDKLYTALNILGRDSFTEFVPGPDANLYPATFAPQQASVNLLSEQQFLQNQSKPAKEMDRQEKASFFLSRLSDIAYAMSILPGRKSMIVFSPGFETTGAKTKIEEKNFADDYGLNTEYEGVDQAISGYDKEYSPTPEQDRQVQEFNRRKDAENQAMKLISAGVPIEGIPDFIAGTGASVVVFSPVSSETDFYKTVINRTGGLYVHLGDDLPAAAEKVLSRDRAYYVARIDARAEKSFHDLKRLSVAVAGREIKAPDVLVSPRPMTEYGSLERRFMIAEAMYADFTPASPTVDAFGSDFLYDSSMARIPAFIQISGKKLIEKDVAQYGLEFYAFSLDGQGRIQDFSFIPVRLNMKNKTLKKSLTDNGLRVWTLLASRFGPVTTRLIVVDPLFGEIISAGFKVEMPEAQLVPSVPFFPATNLNWLVWPKPEQKQSRRGMSLEYPYRMSGNLYFPDFAPVIKRGQAGQVFHLTLFNKKPESGNPPIRIQFVDAAGKVTEVDKFGLMQAPNKLDHGGMELFWKLVALPDGLAPGPYNLRVNITDPATGAQTTRDIPVKVE